MKNEGSKIRGGELNTGVNPNVAEKRWQNGGKPLAILKLHCIEEFDEE
jgi:hypothetical protein